MSSAVEASSALNTETNMNSSLTKKQFCCTPHATSSHRRDCQTGRTRGHVLAASATTWTIRPKRRVHRHVKMMGSFFRPPLWTAPKPSNKVSVGDEVYVERESRRPSVTSAGTCIHSQAKHMLNTEAHLRIIRNLYSSGNNQAPNTRKGNSGDIRKCT